MFDNFGPVYIINLKRRSDRKNILESLFKNMSITNYTFIEAVDAQDDISNLVNCFPSGNVSKQEMAVMMSHLKTIKYWLETSESEYAIIFEDDIDFELSRYWGFTWSDFMNSLTIEYDILQLCIHYIDDNFEIKMHMKKENEYSAAFYLIKREYAKTIINKYFINEKYNFAYSDSEHVADHYSLFKKDKCYAMALLTPNPVLGTDNLTIDSDQLKENKYMTDKQRLKDFYNNQLKITELWKNNTLTLNQLLGKKTI